MFQNKNVSDSDLRDAMNMCKARAYHYQQTGFMMFTREELVSAGNEGICEALIHFEPSRGTVKDTKFTSYAYFWINKYIREYITNNKTMLCGDTIGEKWGNAVPYTQSIDAYDNSDNDNAGSDHKDWLGAGVIASNAIEATEHANAIQKLLYHMLTELEPMQSLVMKLSLGIGTLHGDAYDVHRIATACNLSRVQVRLLLGQATAKLTELKAKYAKTYEVAISY